MVPSMLDKPVLVEASVCVYLLLNGSLLVPVSFSGLLVISLMAVVASVLEDIALFDETSWRVDCLVLSIALLSVVAYCGKEAVRKV